MAVTKVPERFEILKRDANRAVTALAKRGEHFDLVFFDPPYAQQKIVAQMAQLKELGLLTATARVVCETDQNAQLPEEIPGFTFVEQRNYGITVLTIYAVEGS